MKRDTHFKILMPVAKMSSKKVEPVGPPRSSVDGTVSPLSATLAPFALVIARG